MFFLKHYIRLLNRRTELLQELQKEFLKEGLLYMNEDYIKQMLGPVSRFSTK